MSQGKNKPEIYSISRSDRKRQVSRRSFLGLAAAPGILGGQHGSASAQGVFPPKLPKKCQGVDAHLSYVNHLAISPDGTMLASLGSGIKLWSMDNYQLLYSIPSEEEKATYICFSPDGKYLLSAGTDGIVGIWDLEDFGRSKLFKEHTDRVEGVEVLNDGETVVSASNDELIFWDLATRKVISQVDFRFSTTCFAINQKKTVLAIGDRYSNISIYSLSPNKLGELVREIDNAHNKNQISALAFHPKGKFLASGGTHISTKWWENPEQEVKIWSVRRGKLKASVHASYHAGTASIAISPDGKEMVTGANLTPIHIWSVPKGKLIKTMDSKKANWKSNARSFLFVDDGDTLITGYNREISFLNYKKKKKITRCLIDLTANTKEKQGVTYSYKTADGQQVTITVPYCKCGSKIPRNAKCVCNTVSGSHCGCVGYSVCGSHYHYWYPN